MDDALETSLKLSPGINFKLNIQPYGKTLTKMIKNFPYWIHLVKSRLKRTQSTEERFNIPLPRSNSLNGHESEIRINSLSFSNIEPLGNSKAGRISWKGQIGSKTVKVCQLFSVSQAKFIEFICKQPLFEDCFPEIIATVDDYMIVNWIDGIDLAKTKQFAKDEAIDSIAKMQAGFHKFEIQEEYSNSGFDYIHHLKSRLHKYLGPIDIPTSISKIIGAVNEMPVSNGSKLSHADVTPRNIIIDSATHELKLIDNEFLSSNSYYLIDIFNTYRSIRHHKQLARRYLSAYQKNGGDLTSILDNSQFYLALWGLRIIVTHIQAGYIKRAFFLADNMVSNKFKSHPLINDIGELIA